MTDAKKVHFQIKPSISAVRFAYLAPIKRGMKNLKVPMHKISIFLDRWVQHNFRDQGQSLPGRHKWKPFKLGGRKKKGREFEPATFNKGTRGARLLQDTGRLRNSFKPFHSHKDAGIGSDVFYAKYHEFGVKAHRLPARRMLPLQKEVRPHAIKIFQKHVEDSVRKGKYPYGKNE